MIFAYTGRRVVRRRGPKTVFVVEKVAATLGVVTLRHVPTRQGFDLGTINVDVETFNQCWIPAPE